MSDSRTTLVAWWRNEFAQEQAAGFGRLNRVPDTQVIRFLDHFASLNDPQRSELIAVLTDWCSYHLSSTALPRQVYEQFARATAFPGRAEGLRYTGMNLLAGLAKDESHGGLAGWFQTRGITGQAMEPPEYLLPDIADLVPVRMPVLKRLVKSAFGKQFAPTLKELGDGICRYDGMLASASMKVVIRYSAKMGRPQLQYQVEVQGHGRSIAVPHLCFESVLGVGFGRWDYLTKENAERSVALLCELIEYVARLPERLPPSDLNPLGGPDQ